MTTPPQTGTRWRLNAGRWLAGYTVSLTGGEIFYVALSWAAVQVTTPRNVSLLLLANALPRAFLLLVGGALVDRAGPKRIAVASDLARAAVMGLAAWALISGVAAVPVLLAAAVLIGIADGFFLPAASSFPSFIAPRDGMTQLQATRTIAVRASIFIGAPVGAFLVSAGSTASAFAVNSVLFLGSVVALALTRVSVDKPYDLLPADRARRWLADIREGLGTAAGHPVLRTLLIVVAFSELGFTGAFTIGIPLLSGAEEWQVGGIGWIMAAFGIGSALTALVLLRFRQLRRGVMIGAALATMGAGLTGVGAMAVVSGGSLGASTASALVCGLGAGVFGTLANSALLLSAPGGKVGRVMALVSLVSFTAMPVSIAAVGELVQHTTATTPFLVSGALMVVGAALALSSDSVRNLRL